MQTKERPTIEFEPMSPVLVFADSPQVTTINCRVGNKHAFVKPDDGGESSLRFAWLYPNGTRITMDNKNDYNWRISIKSSQLRIVKARLSDSGKYACQVSVDELVFVKHVFVKVLTSAGKWPHVTSYFTFVFIFHAHHCMLLQQQSSRNTKTNKSNRTK